MSVRLSKSPPVSPGTERSADPAELPASTLLARACWPGVEFLLYREDIRRPTCWALRDPDHTLIVHLGGTMRRLETEIEGAGQYRLPPSPGDIWLIPAGQRYSSQARGNFITYAEFRISPEAEVELPGEGRKLAELRPLSAHRDEFLYRAMTTLASLAHGGSDLDEMMATRLQLLLRQHLYRNYRTAAQERHASRPVFRLGMATSHRLAEYIEANLGQRITLSGLAAIAGLSVHQLLVAFRACFGTTPAQYVLDRRMARARWLLLNTNRDVSDIAMTTGFCSPSHFSAAFRRRTGESPNGFRNGQRMPRLPHGP
jgi:AraC family transcriptional regulator